MKQKCSAGHVASAPVASVAAKQWGKEQTHPTSFSSPVSCVGFSEPQPPKLQLVSSSQSAGAAHASVCFTKISDLLCFMCSPED